MFKERDLDKATIDAYHAYVQRGIRNDLNSVSLGPGKLPYRTGVGLVLFGICFLIVGILLITLRMRHVYLWDWDAQFLGPFFFIMWLLCWSGSTYLFVLAKRRSNKYRRELYFKPVGDWGVQCVHKSELAREEEMKHDLKSGTTPHKSIKPRSEAYAAANIGHGKGQRPSRDGQDNRAYDKTPDGQRGPPRDDRRGDPRSQTQDRRGPPPDRRGPPRDDRRDDRDRRGPPPPQGQRGPPRDDRDRRGPPPNGQRGPPQDRRGPPPDGHRGPPRDGPPRDDRDRRGPPPEGRRGPPPEGHRGPPRDDRQRGPPPDYSADDSRRPPPGRRSPPPNRGPHPDDRRPPPHARGPPRFAGVERIPDDERRDFKLILNKTHDESDI